jgi:hypothetical protein
MEIVLSYKIPVYINLLSTFNSKVAHGSDFGYFDFISRTI